jgi:hypothetical protein
MKNKQENILTRMAPGGVDVEGDSVEFTKCGYCGIAKGGDEHVGFDLGSSLPPCIRSDYSLPSPLHLVLDCIGQLRSSGGGKVSVRMTSGAASRDKIFIHQQTCPFQHVDQGKCSRKCWNGDKLAQMLSLQDYRLLQVRCGSSNITNFFDYTHHVRKFAAYLIKSIMPAM